MHLLYSIVVACLGAVSLAGVFSLLLLLAAAKASRPVTRPFVECRPLRLAVIIPAHDEELLLAATLQSLLAQKYPVNCLEIVVVADNCSDATAQVGRAAGATVLERTSAAERGKGYALNFAISHLLARPAPPDGFLIVDADTWVDPEFLACMNARLLAGEAPNGLAAWQARYGVLNTQDGWRVSLMAGAFDLVNHVKPLGREALGLSTGLKGNGMAFSRAVAAQVAWPGCSLTEDLDYGLELARRYGLRVGYAPEARVLAQMPADASQGASQRARWEEGRARMARERALPLLGEGLRRRSLLLWDMGWDLLVPPMAELSGLLFVWIVLIAVGAAAHLLPHSEAWAAAAGLAVIGLFLYVLGGFRIAGAPREAYHALLRAPFYALWKFALLLPRATAKISGKKSEEWVRTARTPVSPSPKVPRT